MASDQDIILSGGISVGSFLQRKAESRQAVVNISAKLEDSEDSNVVINLFQQNVLLVNEIVILRKQNCDLITQVTTNTSNYVNIKEELASYKSDLDKDRLVCDVQHAKTVNEFKHQNMLLQKENAELKTMNKDLVDRINDMEGQVKKLQTKIENIDFQNCSQVKKLQTKIEDIDFQNCTRDVFRYWRDGVIAKHTSVDFPKGVSPLPFLKYPKDLLSDDEEGDEEENITDKERAEQIAALAMARDGHLKASAFIVSIGLDPVLILDMHKMNKNRDYDTHDEDSKLKISKKLTSRKNQEALSEIKISLLKIHEGNAAFCIKGKLLSWVISALSVPAVAIVEAEVSGEK